MLDLVKVQPQLADMVDYQADISQQYAKRVDDARDSFSELAINYGDTLARLETAKTSWLVAEALEKLDKTNDSPPPLCAYSIIATDGSQISPDRHEHLGAHLINTGSVVISYGQPVRPLLKSDPELFYEEGDVYPTFGGETKEVTGPVMSAKRLTAEARQMQSLIDQAPGEDCVGLMDGTLILWHLEQRPQHMAALEDNDLKKIAFKAFLSMLGAAKAKNIPIAGYISSPRNTEVVNMVRIAKCPHETVNCDRCEGQARSIKAGIASGSAETEPGDAGAKRFGPSEKAFVKKNASPANTANAAWPCRTLDGITDAMLFTGHLDRGQRSALFKSRSEILAAYGEHEVIFFYLDAGPEIARVEIPAWVAADRRLFDMTHALIVSQIEKGRGYPLSLAEAHEQAVVKEADRQIFYRLVQSKMIASGQRVRQSQKNLRKRGALL